MSDPSDPTDAVVTVTWQTVSGNTVTTEQGSGVLIAPDEVLTAAHLVYDAAGGIAPGLTVKGVIAGQAFGDAAASVRALPDADWTQVSSAPGDLALIHLAAPVSGAPAMALGSDFPGGAVTVTGYPLSAGGARASLDETLSPVPGLAGAMQGTPLGLPGDPHGASGGPAWRLVGGVPTVVGLTSSASGATGYFVGLTAADLAEVDTWVAADHASPAAAAPAVTAPASVSASGGRTAAAAAVALAALAESLPAVASHPAIDAALSRVAALLAQDAARLGTGAAFDDVAADTLTWLGDNGAHRNLAAALLEGVTWGHGGGGTGAAVGAVAGSDPGILGYAAAKLAVHVGARAGRSLLAGGF